jgi:hypothetical protein
MNNRAPAITLLATVAVLASTSAGLSQAAPPAPAPASNVPVPFQMSMGDMMNTLIQPRHAKLGLAGHAEDWQLAGYAVAEIRQAFAGIVKAQPRFAGMPVGELVDAAINPPLNAVDAAVKQQDPKAFATAYGQLAQGCNACHVELDHPYVVIKTPDASAFPNQDFSPAK